MSEFKKLPKHIKARSRMANDALLQMKGSMQAEKFMEEIKL